MPINTNKDLQTLLNTLKKSPTGAELIRFAEQHNVKIEIVDNITSDALGSFNVTTNTVEIPSDFKNNNDRTVLTLAHELRHAWQLHNDLSNHSMQFATLDITKFDSLVFSLFHGFLLEKRFSEADAFSTSVQVAYELISDGVLPKDYMTGFDNPADTINSSFYNKLSENPDNLSNGLARRASFDAFFQKTAHQIGDSYYLSKCQIYDLTVFQVFDDINRLFVDPVLKSLWQECIETPKERQKLKNIFNTSANVSRKYLPNIQHLSKYGHMETGGNFITDTAGKSLHSKHYMGSDSDGDILYNDTWKTIQKTTKHVYNYKF